MATGNGGRWRTMVHGGTLEESFDAEDAEPLAWWLCDSCGSKITDTELALVTWRSDDERRAFDFLIVHKSMGSYASCDPGAGQGFKASLELARYVGTDGLARLLSMLSAGPLHDGGTRVRQDALDSFVDLVRRVQTPFYEQARTRFNDPAVASFLEGMNPVRPYQPEVLRRVAIGDLRD